MAIRRRIWNHDDNLFHGAGQARQRQDLPRLLGPDAYADPDRRPPRFALPRLRHHSQQDEPHICTICERSFQYVKKQRQITVDATILFADIRGFTDLSERIEAVQLSEIVSLFQDRCAQAIWAHDGIVNKQMGDGLMAIFNFPIVRNDHAGAAILAALEIQRNCATALNGLTLEALPGRTLGVGVGIHSGEVQIGEFSSFRSDFTAIGGVVNQAARLESQAAAGEILISAETTAKAPALTADAETRMLALKGIEQPVQASVLVKR